MITKNFGSIVKICVCMLIAMSLCFIPSCKKSPQEPEGDSSGQQTISATPPKTPAPSTTKPIVEEPEKPAEAVTETVAETPAAVEAEAPAADTEGLVPIDIKLPKPMFVGTPQDTKVPNLEKPTGKARHYTETNEGKLIDVLARGIKARYVRLYSNGNTSNDLNHYIEVEVYGKPVK